MFSKCNLEYAGAGERTKRKKLSRKTGFRQSVCALLYCFTDFFFQLQQFQYDGYDENVENKKLYCCISFFPPENKRYFKS